MMLRPGERIVDEAKFVAANTSRSQHCKGRAKEAYQENLDRYYELKKKQAQSIAESFTGTENFV